MSETFISKIQKLRRVVIPPNAFDVMGLKEGDKVRVTIEKLDSSVHLVEKEKNKQ